MTEWKKHLDSEEGKKTRTSLSYQKYGGRVQDYIPFQPNKVDFMPCVVCNHKSVMALEPAEVVNKKNLCYSTILTQHNFQNIIFKL